MKRSILVTMAAALALPGAAMAQQPAPAPAADVGPKVGEMAPDFEFTGITRYGKLASTQKLSDLRGKTVVLAFFPRARTRGCTVQMESYRDRYGTLFNNGRNVVVMAISADADTTLGNWFSDLGTPVMALSDADGTIGKAFQSRPEGRPLHQRHLYVIDGDGRIAYKATPFRELVQEAYDELGAAVAKLNPRPAGPD